MISAREIKQHYSMKQAIDAMHGAFSALSAGACHVPLRYVTQLPNNGMVMLFKPAYVDTEKRASVKFLTQRMNGLIPGIPAIQGMVWVIDAETGEILSIMDGEYLTALRTGAASGLATRCFARKDAETMALFGCGAQGRTQLEAVACERVLKKLLIYDRSKETADLFIAEMKKKLEIEMVYAAEISQLKEADIICTATNATKPLFRKGDLKPGVHINAIGSFQPHMQELDPYILMAAKVYVDQAESCLRESGDLIKPLEAGIIHESHIVGEIGNFCLNRIPGRETEEEITLFKSVGVAIQDFAVANDIYNLSVKESFGTNINLFE
jgi:ornithine cyclodeaminase/alanine dehydrogenase-like protein (mu-crystallin family)